MTRICLDSNVLVAAFATRGLCAEILRIALTECELVVPEAVAEELHRVLREKLQVSPAALAAVEAVLDRCEVAPRTDAPCPIAIRDPDDARVLADALAAGARMLITGDRDLLSVAGKSPIPILSPRALLALARGRHR